MPPRRFGRPPPPSRPWPGEAEQCGWKPDSIHGQGRASLSLSLSPSLSLSLLLSFSPSLPLSFSPSLFLSVLSVLAFSHSRELSLSHLLSPDRLHRREHVVWALALREARKGIRGTLDEQSEFVAELLRELLAQPASDGPNLTMPKRVRQLQVATSGENILSGVRC